MGMDEKCNTGFCFGMKNGIGRTTREEDRKYALRPPVNGPPMQLDLFPLASVMPQASGSLDLRSSSGTLPGEKTSPRIDGGGDGDRSEGRPNAGIRQVPESRGIDVSKFSAPFYYNGASSPNNTIYWNAMNPASGHDMDLKRKSVALYELDKERVHSRVLSVLEEQGGSKKKLRVSKEQCDILEASFSNNNSPEFKRKQALASQMNLLPGKVEVWFQNRRGRSKLKQTEMDCEVLKRCNESLADENGKLHKELQELRALKFASPLSVCPSCANVAPAGNPGAFTLANVKSVFTQGVSPH